MTTENRRSEFQAWYDRAMAIIEQAKVPDHLFPGLTQAMGAMATEFHWQCEETVALRRDAERWRVIADHAVRVQLDVFVDGERGDDGAHVNIEPVRSGWSMQAALVAIVDGIVAAKSETSEGEEHEGDASDPLEVYADKARELGQIWEDA